MSNYKINKIAAQFVKLCAAYSVLTAEQKIEITRLHDVFHHGANPDVEYISGSNLEELEGVLLQTCDGVILNADVLSFFVTLGMRAHMYNSDLKGLLIKVKKDELLKGNFNSYSNFSILDTEKAPVYYCSFLNYEIVQAMEVFDQLYGIDAANIPDWIKDIPVTDQELNACQKAKECYTLKKDNGKIYVLRKGARNNKTEYILKVYHGNMCPRYVSIESTKAGLYAQELGGAVQRVRDLDRQLNLIVFAYESENKKQRDAALKHQKELEKAGQNPKSRFYKGA